MVCRDGAHLSESRPGGGGRLLEVDAARQEERYVIALRGDLDASTADAVEAALSEGEASDAEQIVVDLSDLSFLDSTGLRVLLQATARSESDSNRLRLVRGPRRVQRVFELTNTAAEMPFLD